MEVALVGKSLNKKKKGKIQPRTDHEGNRLVPLAIIFTLIYNNIDFGGLGVACWPLVPKFVGSNPAEAVGFLGRKNLQHAFLRRGSKAVGPMS